MALSVIEFQDPTGEVIIARIPNEGSSEIIFGSSLLYRMVNRLFFSGTVIPQMCSARAVIHSAPKICLF